MELKLFISIFIGYYKNGVLSMKLLYLDVLLHAQLTSSNLHVSFSLSHASFLFS